MRIAILDLCLPDTRFDKHGSIADMIERWIAPHLPEAAFDKIHIAGGAALPAQGAYDGFILTGSEKGVYDEADWMAPLKTWLRAARDARRPLFGVCFGHQVMAEAFGGKAEKAETGFIVGARTYAVGDREVRAHAMHQDQVTRVPPGAAVTARASYCPVAALAYDFPAASVQFHPEYTHPMVRDAVDIFEGWMISETEAAEARASLVANDVAPDLWGEEAAGFFRAHIAPAAD